MAAGLSVSAIGGLLASTGVSTRAEAESLVEAQHATVKKGNPRFTTLVPAADVDPVTLFNEGAIFTAQICLEYLCFPRKDYTLEPKLATSWHSSQPNTWTFNLRKGVKWHDGTHFTADDVVATFDRLTDPKVNSAALSAFKGILSKGHVRKTTPIR
jgi:peptide/nickel transport system substrate-binding protein